MSESREEMLRRVSSFTDDEVWRVIRDGFAKLCEYARGKHFSGSYGLDADVARAHYLRWNAIEARGRDIIASRNGRVRGTPTKRTK